MYTKILKIPKAFGKAVNPKTKKMLVTKSGVKEDLRILLQVNAGILFNKANPYIIKVLIIKAILVIKILKIPSI